MLVIKRLYEQTSVSSQTSPVFDQLLTLTRAILSLSAEITTGGEEISLQRELSLSLSVDLTHRDQLNVSLH